MRGMSKRLDGNQRIRKRRRKGREIVRGGGRIGSGRVGEGYKSSGQGRRLGERLNMHR